MNRIEINKCEVHFKACQCREMEFQRMDNMLQEVRRLLDDSRLRFICKCNNGHVCLKHTIEKVKERLLR